MSDTPRRVHALVVGRFHAVTRAQAQWLASLSNQPIDDVICVLTSADHEGTRRNPFSASAREAMLRPSLERTGKPFEIVRLNDVVESAQWVEHVLAGVRSSLGTSLSPAQTTVFSSNHEVQALFSARGFAVVSSEMKGLTPQELVQRVAEGKAWKDEASAETQVWLSRDDVKLQVCALFGEKLVTDDGELGHARDFKSYGAQMDASLRQKLDDLVPWVKPGCIVDQGCGTGKLLVELSTLFPTSRFVGVDLSREFLRLCDANTYGAQDLAFIAGNVIERHMPKGSATTIIYSSVMHEVHSYTGYDVTQIERALSNARESLEAKGHVLIRDGVSPEPSMWRLQFLNTETAATFERFAKEFKKGQGITFERLGLMQVRLRSHDANEFICKKDYLKNWHIEVHEEFGPLTANGWREALKRTGFEVLHCEETTNPWIVKRRYEGAVVLTDDAGKSLPWPATNIVVAGERK